MTKNWIFCLLIIQIQSWYYITNSVKYSWYYTANLIEMKTFGNNLVYTYEFEAQTVQNGGIIF